MKTTNWNEIPIGFFLLLMKHSEGKEWHHLQLKISDAPWTECLGIPMVSSEERSGKMAPEFWSWTKCNLPIWVHEE